MLQRFTDPARHVMAAARLEAGRYQHAYVGTEHMLLGLFGEGSGLSAAALGALGLDEDRVRRGIEARITPGPGPAAPGELPLTPRAQAAIEYAIGYARDLQQREAGPEHLLLGLLHEPEGVAGLVMRDLGLQLESLRERVLKARLEQLKIVERAVRPVRANTARKRRMREELLAHLTEIYNQEQARLGDPAAALQEAARRFGDPVELGQDLQASVPAPERVGYSLSRRFSWQAPESASRYLARVALQVFAMMVCLLVLTTAALYLTLHPHVLLWDRNVWPALRPVAAMTVVLPVDLYVLGLLYFKARDALFGAFGSRKSLRKVFGLELLFAAVVLASAVGFVALADGNLDRLADLLPAYSVAAVACAIGSFAYARVIGPREIGDTMWACLDLAE